MPERGIEIHNGKIVIPGSQMRQMQLGTWASKLTQTIASQVLVSAIVNAIALGGDVEGGQFGVVASITLTGNLRGVRSRVEVNDGITLTGSIYGLYAEVSVLGAGIITGTLEGIRIEHYVEAGATIATVYGIVIANSIASDPTGSYSFIRMQENQASTVNAVFHIEKGVLCTDIEYLFQIGGAGSYAHWTDDSHTTSRGYLKVVGPGATVRYIQLFT